MNNVRTQWEYKSNIIGAVAVELIYFITIIAFFGVIFQLAPKIAGWNMYEFLLYFAIASISNSLSHFLGLWIDWDIIEGHLINHLTRPISEFVFYFELNVIDLVFLFLDTMLAIILTIVFIPNLPLLNVLFGIFLFIISFPLIEIPFAIVRTLAFWHGRVYNLIEMYASFLYNFERIPVAVLTKFFMVFFIAITPAGYLHWYIPTAMILGKITLGYGLLMLVAIIGSDLLLLGIFLLVYKKGLSKYEGFGG